MANKKVTVKANISYTDADGQTATLPQLTFEPEYQAQMHGALDIPDTTVAGDFTIPFGTIAKATCAIIENKTGQNVNVKVNTTALVYNSLADGKSVCLALPATPGTAISAITVTTTTTQDGAGSVAFHLFGDPV